MQLCMSCAGGQPEGSPMYHGWMLGLIRVYPLSSTTCRKMQTRRQQGTAMSLHSVQRDSQAEFCVR